MKRIVLYIFLSMIFCNIGFANDFNYTCTLDVKFKTSDSSRWYNKEIIFNIQNSGNILKIYNKSIDHFYTDQNIILNNPNEVVSSVLNLSEYNKFNSFVLNKNTLIAKYSNMFFDDEGGGEYGIGVCY